MTSDAKAPILPRVAAGEAPAFDECLERYGGIVWSLAKRYCAAGDIDDAVQEVFVALWKNADRYDPAIASEATFVTMISRRKLIDLLRRKQKLADTEPAAEVNELPAPAVPDGVEMIEEVARVRGCMQQLSDEQRRVLDLAICEGLSQTDIASVTGWPLGTVKSHARRGLQLLRRLVGGTNESPNASLRKEGDQ